LITFRSDLLSVEEIADLQERISTLEQETDAEKASYEQQLEQLRTECKDAKDNLVADNLMKSQYSEADLGRWHANKFSSQDFSARFWCQFLGQRTWVVCHQL